ncbi:putative reverse transcriptase domain-containing protein [Tanacetum coccineum]
MPLRRNMNINDVYEQEFEQRVKARMEERLDQFVDQLADRMNDMMNPRRREDCNGRESEGEESENSFFDGDGSSSNEQPDRPRRNQREDNRRWESGMRVNIPEFNGNTLNPGGFINWLIAVEEVLEFKEETDDQLVSRYIGGIRVQIMDSVNMFDPLTFFDAYQRALAFEKQSRRVKISSSLAIPGGGSGLSNVASHFSECKKAGKRTLFAEPEEWEDDGVANDDYKEALVFDDDQYEEEVVTGDVGVNLMVCIFVVDPGSCDNLIAEEAVQKLGLKTENRPKHYKLQWLKKGTEVTVSKRVLVTFSVGTTYKDSVWCDMVPMDTYHLLLGRPWEYDRNTTHNGRANTYSFLFGGVKITLMPNKPKELVKKHTGTLLTLSQFEDELEMGDEVHRAVHDNLVRGNSKYKQDADQVDFEVGDFMWAVLTKDRFPVGEYNKLSTKKIGPLEIIEKIDSNAYRLKLPSHIRCSDVFNVKHLLPYHGDSSNDDLVVNSRANFVYPGGMMQAQAHDQPIRSLERGERRSNLA